MASQACSGPKQFCDLPVEVRAMVYRRLTPTDLLPLRLCCKQIKQEVDEHGEVFICVDQGFRGFRKLFKFRVKSCKILNLTHQHLRRGRLFSHPSSLKEVKFDGNISTTNLLKIIGHCTTIERLTFTHQTLGIENLLANPRVRECLRNNLQFVTELNLQLLRYPLGDPFELESNMEVLFSLTLPKLRTFKLYFSLWGNYLNLLNFLRRHSSSLIDVELQVGDRGDQRNTSLFVQSNQSVVATLRNKINLNLMIKTLKLRKFNFRDDVLNLNKTVSDIFMEILDQQSTLEILQFHSPGEMELSHLRNIVLRNEKSLKEIVVYNLKNPTTRNVGLNGMEMAPQILVLDMSIFEKCTKLQVLALSCVPSNVANEAETGNIRMINLASLPQSVERLHLTGFQLEADELCNFSHRACYLKEALIADAGPMKYSVVLKSFLKHCPSLEYLNVRPVNTRANGNDAWWVELQELSQLYEHFMNIPYDPIDDLDGFEAKISDEDRFWVGQNVKVENIKY